MKHRQISSQTGLVSIIVTVIIMIIISLMVIGFAKLVRRDQVQTLDRQLNTQALYAAETGINDVTELIRASGAPEKSTCDNSAAPYNSLNPVLDATVDIRYTCVLVDPTPESAIYGSTEPHSATVVPVNTASSMTAIWINWGNSTAACSRSSTSPNPNELPAADGWDCENGMLRIDIIPGNQISSRAAMIANTMTFFTYPTDTGSGAVAFSPAATGSKANATCGAAVASNGRNCQIRITGLTLSSYYLRIQPIYRSTTLEISGRNVGVALALQNVQAIVDVTGKARDVLKRLQVRVPLGDFSNAANYPLEIGGTICKDFSYIADSTVTANDATTCPINN